MEAECSRWKMCERRKKKSGGQVRLFKLPPQKIFHALCDVEEMRRLVFSLLVLCFAHRRAK